MMLKVLFCFNCCGAPPSGRPVRSTPKSGAEKLVEEANFKSLLPLNEKDQLLANQIRASNNNNNNDNTNKEYGIKQNNNTSDNKQSGNIIDTLLISKPSRPEDDSTALQASTSATNTAHQSTFMPRLGGGSTFSAGARSEQSDEYGAAYRAGESISLTYDDGSLSPPSSIDIDSFRELPDDNNQISQQSRDLSKTVSTTDSEAFTSSQTVVMPPAAAAYKTTTAEASAQTTSPQTSNAGTTTTTSVEKVITSTTKIGDYARLEYSPVEDLESVTTYSQSRFGSERGTRSQGQLSGPNSTTTSRPSSFKNTSGNVSRRSSQGIESTSISIASQLSNEQQFQQNLTNMLESANSPTTFQPLFGTIGLPLGPPLDSNYTETAKTSPETPGAALTSASQDSINSLDEASVQTPTSRAGTTTTSLATAGAALVNDSVEDSAEIVALTRDPLEGAAGERRARLAQAESIADSTTMTTTGERVESPLSMATTTSGGLTNPTPTPSEMSGNSQNKKKSKLRAGKLFKKLRRGGSKKKDSKEGAAAGSSSKENSIDSKDTIENQ